MQMSDEMQLEIGAFHVLFPSNRVTIPLLLIAFKRGGHKATELMMIRFMDAVQMKFIGNSWWL